MSAKHITASGYHADQVDLSTAGHACPAINPRVKIQRAPWVRFKRAPTVTIFAILIGGIWGYYNFYIADVASENVQLDIVTSVTPYSEGKSLLEVKVRPKNIGKVAVHVERGGFNLYLRRLPNNFGLGRIDPASLVVENKVNIDEKYDEYLLEPGAEYSEEEGFIVSNGAFYQVYAEFDFGADKGADVDVASFVKI